MKKLMVMLAAVAVIGLSQAATCSWASGKLKTAESKDGGWSDTTIKAAGVEVTMNIYLLKNEAAYNDLATATMNDLYTKYNGTTASLTGSNKNGSNYLSSITIEESSAYAGIQYAVAIATYTDSSYGQMYIATRVMTDYPEATGEGTANNIISAVGANSGWASASSPVPEPTSAMLLLLGFAGLALKRKNA